MWSTCDIIILPINQSFPLKRQATQDFPQNWCIDSYKSNQSSHTTHHKSVVAPACAEPPPSARTLLFSHYFGAWDALPTSDVSWSLSLFPRMSNTIFLVHLQTALTHTTDSTFNILLGSTLLVGNILIYVSLQCVVSVYKMWFITLPLIYVLLLYTALHGYMYWSVDGVTVLLHCCLFYAYLAHDLSSFTFPKTCSWKIQRAG